MKIESYLLPQNACSIKHVPRTNQIHSNLWEYQRIQTTNKFNEDFDALSVGGAEVTTKATLTIGLWPKICDPTLFATSLIPTRDIDKGIDERPTRMRQIPTIIVGLATISDGDATR